MKRALVFLASAPSLAAHGFHERLAPVSCEALALRSLQPICSPAPGVWTFTHPLELSGWLRLSPEPRACRLALALDLLHGAGLMWLVIPLEADNASAPSNGALERGCLD